MENGGGEKNEKQMQEQGASYTYWVREMTADAAPLPHPKKLSPQDILSSTQSQPATLGSVWNRVSFLVLSCPLLTLVFFFWPKNYYPLSNILGDGLALSQYVDFHTLFVVVFMILIFFVFLVVY